MPFGATAGYRQKKEPRYWRGGKPFSTHRCRSGQPRSLSVTTRHVWTKTAHFEHTYITLLSSLICINHLKLICFYFITEIKYYKITEIQNGR